MALANLLGLGALGYWFPGTVTTTVQHFCLERASGIVAIEFSDFYPLCRIPCRFTANLFGIVS